MPQLPESSNYQRESKDNIPQSGTTYQTVTYSGGIFQKAPFKALHVDVAGSVQIRGFDGQEATFSNLDVGLWPYGGLALIESGTSADIIVIR